MTTYPPISSKKRETTTGGGEDRRDGNDDHHDNESLRYGHSARRERSLLRGLEEGKAVGGYDDGQGQPHRHISHRGSPAQTTTTTTTSFGLHAATSAKIFTLDGLTDMEDAFIKTPEDVAKGLRTDARRGLTEGEAMKRLREFGRNELEEDPPTPLLELIMEQFKDQLVIILLISAVISFILAFFEEPMDSSDPTGGATISSRATAFVEPLVILLILIANATVGVVQEQRATAAIDALKEYSPDSCNVIRDGKSQKINAIELVPGDLISVAVGDKIAADCRLISVASSSFRVDQAILTGESMSVSKEIEAISDEKAVKQDMNNMLFSGTTVVNGKGKAFVVLTGARTAIGGIHESITSQISEKTPLKRKLDDFGDQLAKVITVVCILVWLINLPNFADPSHHGWLKGAIYYFKIAVALAVAAIPEGLAVIITTCLALGTKKMAAKNAIVRSLPSVETLGCTQVICSDKTGTLTTNQMSVTKIVVTDAISGKLSEYNISGSSFAPTGTVTDDHGNQVVALDAKNSVINELAIVCASCNDSKIHYDDRTGVYSNIGEPTEAALRVLVEKLKSDDETFNATLGNLTAAERCSAVNDYYENRYRRLLTFEFSRDRKSMSILAERDGKGSILCKGAPESVIERCSSIRFGSGKTAPLNAKLRQELLEKTLEYGKKGLRTLAMAVIDDASLDLEVYKSHARNSAYDKIEQNMTFIGMAGMLDPPRRGVRQSIARCKSAGIRIIVITGDNKNTAETICRDIGIFGPTEDLEGKSFTGREFDSLSEREKSDAVRHASLFSRTEPSHKSKLVDLLQAQGLVVAMTGDGVNDAPALKKADIGVAMGSGTDVAKLASDMVLADDNFNTIELAVEEGRSIYENTKQFVRYLISSNIGEVVTIFLTVLLGIPESLTPVQLLWMNLVTDGLPATALSFNVPDAAIMSKPPRNPREPLVTRWLLVRYMTVGLYVGIATIAGFTWWFTTYSGGPQISWYELSHFHRCASEFPQIGCELFSASGLARPASTVALSILVTIEMANSFCALSENESLLSLTPLSNPYLIGAVALSMLLHCGILYVPALAKLFGVVPLNWVEWQAIILFSLPVILIDEILKYVTRHYVEPTRSPTQVGRSGSLEDSLK